MSAAKETLDRVKAATVYIRCTFTRDGTTGSGFFVNQTGYIVTNWHVVIDNPRKPRLLAEKIEIVVASGTPKQHTLRAKVVGYDADADLALLQVTGPDLPVPLQFGKADHLTETEDVFLFGFPGGEALGQNISVNKTTVSSIRREGKDVKRVDFAGGSFFGSSGGPVTNMSGEVVGVCRGGILGSQINFAIPAEVATAFVEEQIRTGGTLKKAWPAEPDRGSSRKKPKREREEEDSEDVEEDRRRKPRKPVATVGTFGSIPTGLLTGLYIAWFLLTVGICVVVGGDNVPVRVVLGFLLVALATPISWELYQRQNGRRKYDPYGPGSLPPTPAMARVVPDAELAGRPKIDPDDDPRELDGEPVAGPPEEEFWEQHNKRLEFPLSAVASVFLHVLVIALLAYIIVGLMDTGEDRSNPDLKLMQVGGLDDAGDGSPGSGGVNDPDRILDVDPTRSPEKSLTPKELADAKANINNAIALTDPTVGKLPIAPSNAKAYSELDEALKKKLLEGARQGEGNQPGKGHDPTPGSGVGGTGADSTRARGLRWVLRFSVRGGGDYIDQLRSMGAEILIPIDDKRSIIVPDLGNPKSNRIATDADLKRLAGKIQFSDNRRAMVKEVIDTLGLSVSGQPKAFWAFFPKEVEEDLARKEKAYRNRSPEAIEETVYRVTVRGGTFETVVEDQILKR